MYIVDALGMVASVRAGFGIRVHRFSAESDDDDLGRSCGARGLLRTGPLTLSEPDNPLVASRFSVLVCIKFSFVCRWSYNLAL